MTTKIDIERLNYLLDRGDAAISADHQARGAHVDALRALSDARAELAEGEILAQQRRALNVPLETLRANVTAHEQRTQRRAAALHGSGRRANLWKTYCDGLRTLAKKNGVATA